MSGQTDQWSVVRDRSGLGALFVRLWTTKKKKKKRRGAASRQLIKIPCLLFVVYLYLDSVFMCMLVVSTVYNTVPQ